MFSNASRTSVMTRISCLALAAAATAAPPWWDAANKRGYDRQVPDMYQHQKWGTGANGDVNADREWQWIDGEAGGWCLQVAIYNACVKVHAAGTPLVAAGSNGGANWLTLANNQIKSFAREMIVNGKSMKQLLPASVLYKRLYMRGGVLTYDSWRGPAEYPSGARSLFEAARDEFLEDNGVVFKIVRDPPNTARQWWGNFHALTVTGIEDGATKRIYFADPDVNLGNLDARSVFDWTRPNAGCTAQRFAANAGAGAYPVPAAAAAGVLPGNWATYWNRCEVVGDKLKRDAANNARYDKYPINELRVVEPRLLWLDPPVPAPGLPGRSAQRAVCSVSRHGRTDDIFIFPRTPVQNVPAVLSGPTFSGWNAIVYPTNVANPYQDPWGNRWIFGAIRIFKSSIGQPLAWSANPTDSVTFTMLGSTPFTDCDIFYRDADNPGTWRVQSIGAEVFEDAVQRPDDNGGGGNCPADFNQDGGIDGGDVDAFFDAWEAGDASADVNQDGGIDGADVSYFFNAWEAGGCG